MPAPVGTPEACYDDDEMLGIQPKRPLSLWQNPERSTFDDQFIALLLCWIANKYLIHTTRKARGLIFSFPGAKKS